MLWVSLNLILSLFIRIMRRFIIFPVTYIIGYTFFLASPTIYIQVDWLITFRFAHSIFRFEMHVIYRYINRVTSRNVMDDDDQHYKSLTLYAGFIRKS